MATSSWALSQLSQILPLDHDSLQQLLEYTSTLTKDASANHLKDILGDSPKALEFISSYNSRRQEPSPASEAPSEPPTAVPRSQTKKKGKPPLNKLPAPRQVENRGNTIGAYQKKDEEDYMTGKKKPQVKQEPALANTLALSDKPDARQMPKPTTKTPSLKPPPSASGPLISDLPNVRTGSRTSSRTSSPVPKTTVTISGGPSMHGASTTLQDLDSAIRTLELQTNPSLASSGSAQSTSARACTCNATRHALLTAAPNCLNCGKIVCAKEGIGPCTFCGTPLLSSAEVTSMIESLKRERGQERMLANNAATSGGNSHRRADVSSTARPLTSSPLPPPSAPSEEGGGNEQDAATLDLAKAKQHRDRLLRYQAENARRTRIHDEAADYETPASGLSQWSSPVERARQLKQQQKVLREQEWNAKPEYERRKVVASIDLVGGKAVKRVVNVERPRKEGEKKQGGDGVAEEEGDEEDLTMDGDSTVGGFGKGQVGGGQGAFSKNPLIGKLIRPVWKAKHEHEDEHKGKSKVIDATGDADADAEAEAEANKENTDTPRQSTWRRVQDDNDDDNEAVILDGGVYGRREWKSDDDRREWENDGH